jgi:hypothetical protein
MDNSHKLAQCQVQGVDFSHRGSVCIEANNTLELLLDFTCCVFFNNVISFC